MLTGLSVQNVALIKNIRIQFHKGLNIITGETGSGKSVLINSIRAVIGDRVYREMIRTGCDSALIEAEFLPNPYVVDAIKALGINTEYGKPLILSRDINKNGKNTCKINDVNTNVSMLSQVGAYLIDIHGQFDSRNLTSTETHIQMLDQFGQKKLPILLDEYNLKLNDFRNTINNLKRYADNDKELERKIDMLKYQINEIELAKLKNGEEDSLLQQKDILTNAEKIINTLSFMNQLLNDGEMNVGSMLNQSLSYLSSISKYKKEYQETEKMLRDITYQMEDICSSTKTFLQDMEYDPNELDSIQDRLEVIKTLKKKYGNSIDNIFEYYEYAKKELELLQNSETIIADLKLKIDKQKKELYETAVIINNERCKLAEILETGIVMELNDMEMKKVKLKVQVMFPDYENVKDSDFTENGLNQVEFLISPNAGEEFKPLAKIASGGEISRIMLAMKTLLSDGNKIPVMIFDEIDSGISGEAALKTGHKIYDISKTCQVICVTHLPQIASMADHHYTINKETNDGSVYTTVYELDRNKRAVRIANLLDGNVITDTGLKHANDMLEKADAYKDPGINC